MHVPRIIRQATGQSSSSSTSRRTRLRCEPLEARRLLDGAGFGADINETDHPDVIDDPNVPRVHVSGTKWADLNGDGQRSDDEPGLGGVTIYTDLNHNGRLDDDEPRAETSEDDPSTNVDEGGRYALDNLSPGLHIIREVVPDGFVQTFPSFDFIGIPEDPEIPDELIEAGSHVLFLEPGDEVDRIDFGNLKIGSGQIQGRKWEDLNGDGRRSDDEPGLGGVTIFSDMNFNGVRDRHEPFAVTLHDDPDTDFDEAGLYTLENLRPGYHTVREVVPDGFEQTFPALQPGYLPPPWGDASVHVVFVDEGATVEGIDFGNRRLEPGSVHGVKWLDKNGNAERDDDEPGLPGVTIYSDRNLNGVFDPDEPHAVSMEDDPNTDFDESGRYWLENLQPGWHWIREVIPDGFLQTFPVSPIFFADLAEPFPIDPEGNVIFPFPGLEGAAHDVFIASGQVIEGIDFGNQKIEPSSIHGVKWEDLNGNGERDANEPGLAGVVIYSDRNFNGRFDLDEPHTETMKDDPETDFDEAGHYWLENLRPGLHYVREVVPDGYWQTFPFGPVALPLAVEPALVDIFPPHGGTHVVHLVSGQVVEGIDFGNQKIEPGSVHGVKWLDKNGNSERDADEPGLPGVTIYSDVNQNGVFDPDEPHAVTMEDIPETDFDEGGLYWIENLDPGWHWIKEVVPDGFQQTFPIYPVFFGPPEEGFPGDAQADVIFPFPGIENAAHDVFIKPGQAIEGIDFGNQKIEPGSIHGVKWEDLNGNGQRDANEPGLPGVVIYSDLNFNGRLDDDEPRAETMKDDPDTDFDEGGRYWLEGLRPGFHHVREVLPDGYWQTFPVGPIALPLDVEPALVDIFFPPHDGAHFVHLGSGQVVEGIDFGNQKLEPSSIHGVKWEDFNGNGRRDDNEPGLPGVTIYADQNLNGRLDPNEPHAVTMRDDPNTDFDEAGHYWLAELKPGVYYIREVVPDGYRQTFPYEPRPFEPWPQEPFPPELIEIWPPFDDLHVVHLGSGQVVEGIDFGNQPIEPGSIHGVKWLDANGNAEFDPHEPGVAGVVIYVDENNNGRFDEHEHHTVTMKDDPATDFDETGHYWLEGLEPGLHIVREVLPDGFEQTYPLHGPILFPPDDGIVDEFAVVQPERLDLRLEEGEIFHTEVAVTILASLFVPIEIDVIANNSDIEFENVTGVQVNGGSGTTSVFEIMMIHDGGQHAFHLEFVGADGQIIAAIPVAINRPEKGDGAHRVFLEPGESVDGIDFGNRPVERASVHGRKWLDRNGNREQDPNEPGVPGVVIYSDRNFNGVLDADEPHTVTMKDDPDTDFDESGLYWLEGLAAGHHWIAEVVPLGYEQTFPSNPVIAIFPPAPGGGVHDVRLQPGETLEGIDFGNRQVEPGGVHGIKWHDANANGRRDPDELGLGGVTIYADLNFNGRLDFGEPHAETMEEDPFTDFDEGGLYWLETQPGFQAIREVVPDGFEQTFPISDALSPHEQGAHFVTVEPNTILEGIDFGNIRVVDQPRPQMDGDFNHDGAVDIIDLGIWEEAYRSDAPLTNEGTEGFATSGDDFLDWQRNFGRTDALNAVALVDLADDASAAGAGLSGDSFLTWQRNFGASADSPHVGPQAASITFRSVPAISDEHDRAAISAGLSVPAGLLSGDVSPAETVDRSALHATAFDEAVAALAVPRELPSTVYDPHSSVLADREAPEDESDSESSDVAVDLALATLLE